MKVLGLHRFYLRCKWHNLYMKASNSTVQLCSTYCNLYQTGRKFRNFVDPSSQTWGRWLPESNLEMRYISMHLLDFWYVA